MSEDPEEVWKVNSILNFNVIFILWVVTVVRMDTVLEMVTGPMIVTILLMVDFLSIGDICIIAAISENDEKGG